MTRSFSFLLLTLMFLALSFSSQANSNGPVVAVPIIAQLVKKDESSRQWSGPLIDVLKSVEQQAGVHFQLRFVPFKRAVVMTKEGESDFGVFMESPKRNKMAMPIVKLGDAIFVVVSLKDKPITNLTELDGKVLGRIRGGTDVKSLTAVPNLKYHYFNNHEDGVRLLKVGRIDALLTADFRVLDAIEKFGLSYDEIARPLEVEPRGLWLYWSWESKQDFNLVRTIKKLPALSISNMGTVNLYEKYQQKAKN
ncbi:transporter substrate-binding domain-containing protein [Terasakiella sp. SH-1]|uniref:substrate-binding periplasmic protein n=1 Tax=Terasakiella sp. SH-1 TaxID=2560057 RepID=UPI00142F466E|nr:transporter substrate-binding domain-containing protein [Terasakiella sp. SH-1]